MHPRKIGAAKPLMHCASKHTIHGTLTSALAYDFSQIVR